MRPYLSPILFHGPGARDEALREVQEIGRLIHEPFGEEGLKIADSREISELMNNATVGDIPAVIVMGPMDRAQQMATDVLLKSLEEFQPDAIRPVLWAFNEDDVSGTIRSRCLRRWCPANVEIDDLLLEEADTLVGAALKHDRALVIETLNKHDPLELATAAVEILRRRGINRQTGTLWTTLRAALSVNKPTPTEILVAFL